MTPMVPKLGRSRLGHPEACWTDSLAYLASSRPMRNCLRKGVWLLRNNIWGCPLAWTHIPPHTYHLSFVIIREIIIMYFIYETNTSSFFSERGHNVTLQFKVGVPYWTPGNHSDIRATELKNNNSHNNNKPPTTCVNFPAMTSESHSSWCCVFSWRYLSNLITKTRLDEG